MAPTTPPERRRAICEGAEGFVYLVSTVGVTGEREELPPELTNLISASKEEADVPVAVGFGIATPDQAAAVGDTADGVIIGSRLVRAVADAPDARAGAEAAGALLREFRSALESAEALPEPGEIGLDRIVAAHDAVSDQYARTPR